MTALTTLDTWLVGKTESFCHWFQRMTGWNCYRLLQLCHVLSTACLITEIAVTRKYFVTNSILVFVSLFDVFYVIPWKERAAESRLLRQVSNPSKLTDRIWRIMTVLIVVPFDGVGWYALAMFRMDSRHWSGHVWALLLVLRGYLDACDPLPPCIGRIKEWLSSGHLTPVPVENS